MVKILHIQLWIYVLWIPLTLICRMKHYQQWWCSLHILWMLLWSKYLAFNQLKILSQVSSHPQSWSLRSKPSHHLCVGIQFNCMAFRLQRSQFQLEATAHLSPICKTRWCFCTKDLSKELSWIFQEWVLEQTCYHQSCGSYLCCYRKRQYMRGTSSIPHWSLQLHWQLSPTRRNLFPGNMLKRSWTKLAIHKHFDWSTFWHRPMTPSTWSKHSSSQCQ